VWPASVAASLSALVDLAKATGSAELVACEPNDRLMRLALRWSTPGR